MIKLFNYTKAVDGFDFEKLIIEVNILEGFLPR